MGTDWEQILDADGSNLEQAYDHAASDALYQDHPSAQFAGNPRDPGDEPLNLPFDEITEDPDAG